MKKLQAIICAMLVAASLAACGGPAVTDPPAVTGDATQTEDNTSVVPPSGDISVGVAIYKFDDTFMTGVRNAITAQAQVLGVTADIVDSQNTQPKQNDQVDAFITKGVNSLAINAVDRQAAGPIIDKAKAANLPIVFLNREPEAADMASYDKVWYVGAKAEESGTMSGQILVDYWKAHPEMDKNKDGKMQYVMLRGEQGHQDAELRRTFSIKCIEDAGIGTECLAEDHANWDKVKATDLMNTFISAQSLDKIEAVLANNDDMALGAIEALKANGFNTGDMSKYIPVVGVDATAPALESMAKGELLGTVLNDADNQGIATINIAAAAAKGLPIDKANVGYDVTDGKYVWVPYVKVTSENLGQFMDTSSIPQPEKVDVSVGVAIYKFDDTFMTGVRNAISARAGVLGATVDIVDSQNTQPKQNDQVDAFITKGMQALAINAVDRQAAAPIIEKAKSAGLPIVFLNREPVEADMASYDKVWYVGAKAEESGTMSGQILVDYWKAHPEMDKNTDGKMQYVMLRGEQGHQDAELRREYSIKCINDAGIGTECLAEDHANWDKVKATDLMNTFISAQGLDKIEAVLANNDDMALGAIEALKANGYNTGDASKYIPVVGVDATAPALESMSKGELLGTVLNDAVNQGEATINVAAAAAQGKEINKDTVGYDVTDGKYIWVPYVKVTAENYQQFQ